MYRVFFIRFRESVHIYYHFKITVAVLKTTVRVVAILHLM